MSADADSAGVALHVERNPGSGRRLNALRITARQLIRTDTNQAGPGRSVWRC